MPCGISTDCFINRNKFVFWTQPKNKSNIVCELAATCDKNKVTNVISPGDVKSE